MLADQSPWGFSTDTVQGGGDDPSVGLPLLLCQQLQHLVYLGSFPSSGLEAGAKRVGLVMVKAYALSHPMHPTPEHKPPFKGEPGRGHEMFLFVYQIYFNYN